MHLMKRNKHLLKIAIISTICAMGIGLTIYHNINPTKVVAEQHLSNYDLYTYSGSYYNGINFNAEEGMDGALRLSLTNLIIPEGFYKYSSSGANTLSTQLQYCDEDPTNSNNMVYLYTRNSVPKSAARVNNADVWNREHVWCQSLSNGNWGTDEGGTDLLHLRPVYYSVNSSRGNTPYGDINKANPKYYDIDKGKVTNDNTKMLFGYSNGDYFEPIDATKGDVAREVMYLWVAYTGYTTPGGTSYKPLNILNVFKDYNTLLTWHTQDKPDVLEGNRNDYVQTSKQKNRNPFVDHPELAWKIFGNMVSSAVKTACQEAYPYNNGQDPIDPTGIRLNKSSASLKVDETVQLIANLEPSGAIGDITWSSSNESIAVVDDTGLVTAKAAGVATITARVSQSIYAQCTLNIEEPSTTTIFTANMTSTMSVTPAGYNLMSNYVLKKSGYYQDTGTYDVSECTVGAYKNTALFNYVPSKIYISAYLGSGVTKDPLDHNVEACLVDSSGNEIEGTRVTITNKITQDPLTYKALVPYNANACGAKLCHIKANGHNIRYYTFSVLVDDSPSYPDEYLGSTAPVVNLYGSSTSNMLPMTSSVTFSEKMTNGQVITSGFRVGQITLTGLRGSHPSSNPQYLSNGSALRVYGGNTLVFTADRNISEITFSYGSGSDSNLSTDEGSLVGSTWQCYSNVVTFTASVESGKHIKITGVTVSYEGDVVSSIDSLALRLGVTIPKTDWNMISDKWTISDYGVMLVRETTLLDTYDESSVEEAFNAGKDLAVVHKGSGETPFESGSNYLFTARVNITTSNYDVVFCSAPFIVINDNYYFLEEMRYSVKELAELSLNNGSSNLSNAALIYIMEN